MKAKSLILFCAFTYFLGALSAEAAVDKLRHPDHSQLFKKILIGLEKHNKKQDIDELDRLIVQDKKGNELAADLILSDIIDQMHLCMYQKRIRQTHLRLKSMLGHQPLQNFLPWWKEVTRLSKIEGKAASCRKGLKVQLYDVTGRLLASNMGGIFKIFRKHWGSRYDELMADPEGTHIAHFIFLQRKGRNIPNSLFTPRVTVTKYRLNTRSFNGYYRRQYYQQYFNLLKNNEEELFHTYIAQEKNNFTYSLKPGASNLIAIYASSGSNQDFIHTTVPLFNSMYALPYKLELFRFIKKHLRIEHKIEVPEIKWQGMNHILLTPSFVHQHRQQIAPLVKEFTFTYRLQGSDLNYLLHMRKWVRSNLHEIHRRALEKNIYVSYHQSSAYLPSNSEIIENYDALSLLFPESPWVKTMPALDANGRPIYKGGRMRRIMLRTRDFLKNLVSIENISSLVIGTAIYLGTGNPILSAISGSVVRDLVHAARYNISPRNYVPRMFFNMGVASILAAGFTGGRIPEQIFLGGMMGAGQALATGQSLKVGALAGSIQNVLLGMLPARWHTPTLNGLGKDLLWKNALLEITETALKRGLTGLAISVVTKGDPVEGVLQGVAFGAAEASVKITILGFRYRPDLDDNDWSEEIAYQQEHGVGAANIDDRLFQETTFRRNGLFQVFYRRSFSLGNQVIMDPEVVGNTEVEEHEMSHRSQNRYFGILGFNMRYILENFRNGSHGSNIYENYRYLDDFVEVAGNARRTNGTIIRIIEAGGSQLSRVKN